MNEGAVDIPFGMPPVHLFNRTMLFFTPVFTAGGATFDLELTNRTTNQTVSFNGSGAVIGGGFNFTIMSDDCPWFGGVDMLYRTNLNPTVTATVHPSPTTTNGANEKNNLSFYQWNAEARGGYDFATGGKVFRSVAPWAGVAFNSTNLTLKSTQQTASLNVGVAANDFRGVVGVDTHLWGPIFARSQVSFNDEDYSVMAKLVYQIDFCDLWHQ